MIIVGSRPSTSVPQMRASQIINLQDGETRTIPGVGALHFQVSEDHQHWHLNRFMTYELRDRDDVPDSRPRSEDRVLSRRPLRRLVL